MMFGRWGVDSGGVAIRGAQGHTGNAGVSPDYLKLAGNPGVLAHGTSVENARDICETGLGRPGRLRVHFRTMQSGGGRLALCQDRKL